jgi:DNA-binding IclR family transcriptional regulator
VTDPSKLRAILAEAHRDGYAIERDQTELGRHVFWRPIFRGGSVVAAVSISAPSARAGGSERDWIKFLRDAAGAIGRKLDKRERAIA